MSGRWSDGIALICSIRIFSIFRGGRGLSLSKAVGFDRLNQRHPYFLRRYIFYFLIRANPLDPPDPCSIFGCGLAML
jgi:hypothetical protein